MKHEDMRWRFLAVFLLVAILAGSISAVSYAFDWDERVLNEEGNWNLKVTAGKYREKNATPSVASHQLLFREGGLASPSDMLEQVQSGGTPGAIEAEWFRVLIDGETARDSDRPHITLKDGREIPPDGEAEYRMKAIFDVAEGGMESGDYVEWNFGSYPGLSLPEESWEEVIIEGTLVGEAYLRYEADGTLCLGTVFAEGINRFSTFYITYTYKSGFLPVYERTPLEFHFPGRDEVTKIILLPVSRPEPDEPDITDGESETEETSTRADGEEETTAEETTAEETTPQETTAEPSESGRPSGGGSSGGSGGSSTGTQTAAESAIASVMEPETQPKAEIPVEPTLPEPSQQPEAEPKEKPEREAASAAKEKKQQEDDDKREEPTQVEINVAWSAGGGQTVAEAVKNGDRITCTIELKNNGDTEVKDVRLRDYLPKHTSFLSASDGGVWGIREGQERVTWKIDLIEPGESLVLEINLQVYSCTPAGYRLEQTLHWQDKDQESVNSTKDPGSSLAVPAITVG